MEVETLKAGSLGMVWMDELIKRTRPQEEAEGKADVLEKRK